MQIKDPWGLACPASPQGRRQHHEEEGGNAPWGWTKELAGRARLGQMKSQADGPQHAARKEDPGGSGLLAMALRYGERS